MIIKKVVKYGHSGIVRVTKEFNEGERVVILSEEEYKNLLRGVQ